MLVSSLALLSDFRLQRLDQILKRGRRNSHVTLKRIAHCQNEIQHQADEYRVKKNEHDERRLWSIGPEARHCNQKPEDDDKYINRWFCQSAIQTDNTVVGKRIDVGHDVRQQLLLDWPASDLLHPQLAAFSRPRLAD